MSPQSERSARAIFEALAIPTSATALKHDTKHFVELNMACASPFDTTLPSRKRANRLGGFSILRDAISEATVHYVLQMLCCHASGMRFAGPPLTLDPTWCAC
jgi:hypothetical protein